MKKNIFNTIFFVIIKTLLIVNIKAITQQQQKPVLTENDILKLSLRTHVNKIFHTSVIHHVKNKSRFVSFPLSMLSSSLFRTNSSNENAFSINYNNKTMKEELRTIFSKVHFSFKSKNLRTKNTQKTKGALPACSCKWPDLSQDGAKPQSCPPPNIKCEICMGSVNALRYGNNPINYCGGNVNIDTDTENPDAGEDTVATYEDYCRVAGGEMYGVSFQVTDLIRQLTKRFGEGYGASHEICTNFGCCDEKPTHTDLPGWEPGAIRNKVTGRDPVSGGHGGNDNMYNNVGGVADAKGPDLSTNGGTHQGPGSGSRKDQV